MQAYTSVLPFEGVNPYIFTSRIEKIVVCKIVEIVVADSSRHRDPQTPTDLIRGCLDGSSILVCDPELVIGLALA